MVTDDEREVYRQRSETARHCYRLEWQFFQVGTAIGLITLGLGADSSQLEWWRLCVGGIVFVAFSCAMERMAHGFKGNYPYLYHHARRIGDAGFHKKNKSWWTSAACWARLSLHFVGIVLLIKGVRNAYCAYYWLQNCVIVVLFLELIFWLALQMDIICANALGTLGVIRRILAWMTRIGHIVIASVIMYLLLTC